MPSPSTHVLIIGGGIGGLALAQNLKKRGISFTLFERDASPSVRAQGYRIRIAGQGAEGVRDCLDDTLFTLFEATCAETKAPRAQLNALDGKPLDLGRPLQRPATAVERPEMMGKQYTVDRTMLRSLFLLGQDDNVKFDKTFSHYETTATGITAFFTDGTKESGTLLVGADGTGSLVRKQLLPNLKYVDTRSRAIYGKTPLSGDLVARFSPEAMKGMSIIKDDTGHMLFMEPVRFPKDAAVESNGRLSHADDYVYWVFGGPAEDMGLSDEVFRSLSSADAARLTVGLTAHWDASFKPLFELQNTAQSAPLRLVSSKPERPDWTPSADVVLIGDAIHAMMPAGGSGANCALADASLLGRVIAGKGVSQQSMADFVDQMLNRALPFVEGSASAAVKLFGFRGFEDAKEVEF